MEKIYSKCETCNGTGIAFVGNPPSNRTCGHCSGLGYVDSGETLDGAALDDATLNALSPMDAKLDDMVTKLTYVYSKTDNIINKLNDIKDKVDQIWDKVK